MRATAIAFAAAPIGSPFRFAHPAPRVGHGLYIKIDDQQARLEETVAWAPDGYEVDVPPGVLVVLKRRRR